MSAYFRMLPHTSAFFRIIPGKGLVGLAGKPGKWAFSPFSSGNHCRQTGSNENHTASTRFQSRSVTVSHGDNYGQLRQKRKGKLCKHFLESATVPVAARASRADFPRMLCLARHQTRRARCTRSHPWWPIMGNYGQLRAINKPKK